MTDVEIAWLAGLIEGEGCFQSTRLKKNGKEYFYPRIKLSMADEDIIRRAQTVSGAGHVYGPYHAPSMPEHHKERWLWSVTTRDDALAVMDAVYPWMGSRRKAKLDLIFAQRDVRLGHSTQRKLTPMGRVQDNEVYKLRTNGTRLRGIQKICECCGNEFVAWPERLRPNAGRFCSPSCARKQPRKRVA